MVMVSVDASKPVIKVGLNATVTPTGWLLAERATAVLKPPPTATAIVDVPLAPGATVIELGEADTA